MTPKRLNDKYSDLTALFRSERSNTERPDKHARALAERFTISEKARVAGHFYPRLRDTERFLDGAYQTWTKAARAENAIPPVAELFLDNFYPLKRQILEIRQGLKSELNGKLPALNPEPYAGQPRVYALAVELIAFTDGQIDTATITRFLRAYQSAVPLGLAEVRAFPVMLAWCLVENIRRYVENGQAQSLPAPSDDARHTDEYSLARLIATLRGLAPIVWESLIETWSKLHQVLSRDPAGAYLESDYETRERYRRAVETLGRHSPRAELEIGALVVALADRASVRGTRRSHVGYYLIDKGVAELSARLGRHKGWGARAVGEFGKRALPLPKLEFNQGIPDHARTLVLVSNLGQVKSAVEKIVSDLELLWLKNRDENLFFALLVDSGDGQALAERNGWCEQARQSIRTLNEQYAARGRERFYLLHRGSQLNDAPDTKATRPTCPEFIVDLALVLDGAAPSAIKPEVGSACPLPPFNFVILLDAGTDLPLNTARRLVGTIAHPLNRVEIDPASAEGVAGYGTVQPCLGVTDDSAARTRWARIMTSDIVPGNSAESTPGVEPSTFKLRGDSANAIYDVDLIRKVFEQSHSQNPPNPRELAASGFARAALATEIVVLRDFPTNLAEFRIREKQAPRTMVRRLVAPLVFILLLMGWIVLPGAAVLWTMLALVLLWLPQFREMISFFPAHPEGELWRDYFHVGAAQVGRSALRGVLALSLLPVRVLDTSINSLVPVWSASLIAVFCFAVVAWLQPSSLSVALPILLLWLAAPLIDSVTSRPIIRGGEPLAETARNDLQQLAPKTWQYFERYATGEEHWLPPDNVRIAPGRAIAHRTSPTNIGYHLLSLVAAFDLHLISSYEFLLRLERVIETLSGMKRLRGHWYNWYNTRTLEVLSPLFVSSVDSGNLAGAFIVLRQACLEIKATDTERAGRWNSIAERLGAFVGAIDFRFLYDPNRELFSIGYDAMSGRNEDRYYDLFGSEARLTSYITIALGQAPERHWFQLGRPFGRVNGRPTLVCWGGSLFEYLMPTQFFPDCPGSLSEETYRRVIDCHIQYGSGLRVPWGNAEAGFYAFDDALNYKYKMFGVPALSVRTEIIPEVVVPSYASFLAMKYAPARAWENLQALARYGGVGEMGFLEACDFTPDRVPPGQSAGVVQEYMAHHQGMILVALDNLLNEGAIRRRFWRDPVMAAAESLLHERLPHHIATITRP